MKQHMTKLFDGRWIDVCSIRLIEVVEEENKWGVCYFLDPISQSTKVVSLHPSEDSAREEENKVLHAIHWANVGHQESVKRQQLSSLQADIKKYLSNKE